MKIIKIYFSLKTNFKVYVCSIKTKNIHTYPNHKRVHNRFCMKASDPRVYIYILFLSKTNKYTCILLSHLPSCKLYYRLLVFGICMYTYSFDKTYIYLEVCF